MKHKKSLLTLISTAIFVALFVCCSKTASALTILPVRLEVSGDPGQIVSKEMTLINDQEKPLTFYSSYMNFEAQGDSGTPSFVPAKEDIGTWISANDSVTLQPNETKSVPITISIPEDARAGGHFGAVFWGTSPNSAAPGQVAISAKTGMLVLLTVNGDIKEAGGLTDFNTLDNKFWYSSLPVSFIYHFKNDGADRVKPAGTITIRDTIFIPTEHLDANPVQGNILPSSTRKFQVNWGPIDEATLQAYHESGFFKHAAYQWKHFALGFYSARMELVYGSTGEQVAATTHFFVFPWQLVVVILIVLFLIFWGGRKLLDRYNHYIIRKAQSILREK